MKNFARSVSAVVGSAALVLAPSLAVNASAAAPAKARAYTCQGHKATIVSSAKVITGTKKSDVIVVLGKGTHVVNGAAGNDIICGSNTGTNVINGGPGNDTIVAGKGANVIDGNQGKDTVIAAAGRSTIHSDGLDRIVKSRTAHAVVADDSVYPVAAIPQAVRDVLQQSGDYLAKGILAGDVTGSGLQAALPNAPSVGAAPTSTLLTSVMWNITTDTNGPRGYECVEASADNTLFFKYIAKIHDAKFRPHLTTGKCMTAPTAPAPTADVNAALNAGRDQMFLAITTNTISGNGDQTVLPDVADVVTPNSPLIKRVLWNINSDGTRAEFCVEATADGTAYFSMEGRVADGNTRAHLESGQCETSSDRHHRPTLSKATGDFLLAARDYMAAGIVGGYITGTGSQATFPAGNPDTVAPTFAGTAQVRWDVASSTPPQARFCIAAVDQTSQGLFRFLGHFDHEGNVEGVITPGDCNFADENPNPGFGPEVASALVLSDAYMVTGISMGTISGTGDQKTLPGDLGGLLGKLAGGNVITHVVWNVTATPADPAFAASFCVAASSDGTHVYSSTVTYDPTYGQWQGGLFNGDCGAGGTQLDGKSNAGGWGSGGHGGGPGGGFGGPGFGGPGFGGPGWGGPGGKH